MRIFSSLLVIALFLGGCSSKLPGKFPSPPPPGPPGPPGPETSESITLVETGQGELDPCKDTETAFRCVKVIEVYDGDTIFVDLPGLHPLFGRRMGVRIFGIDTPELRTKDPCEKSKGIEARTLLMERFSNAKRVDIVDVKKDKYFRILGTVLVDGESVSDHLIEKGLAFPYFGEAKPERDWCTSNG